MSTVPEVLVATHCGMTVFGLSLITNKCIMEYDSENFANHEEVLQTGKSRSQDMQKLIGVMVEQMEDIWAVVTVADQVTDRDNANKWVSSIESNLMTYVTSVGSEHLCICRILSEFMLVTDRIHGLYFS